MFYQNFAYIVRKKAEISPDGIAIVESHNGKEHSYSEICKRANRLAQALSDMGIKKGDRVICITCNTVEYFDIYLAVSILGAILITINYRLSSNEILRIVEDGSPKVLIADGEFSDKVKDIANVKTSIHKFIMFGETATDWANNYDTITHAYSEKESPIRADSEDVVILMYTAGSTGRPKGVPLNHRNFFFKSQDIVVDMGFTRQDITLTLLPVFHIGGNVLYTQAHLHVGAKIVLQRRFSAQETFELIQKYRVTNTFLLPAMMKMMIQIPEWEKYDLSSLRLVGSGGEPVPERVISAFGKYSFPIFNSYGLTETTAEMIFNRPETARGKPAHCIGKPGTCREAKIVDMEGNELGPDQPGEIIVRGPTVADSYWRRPEESAKAFKNGWLYTGDKGVKDSEGFIYFLGRTDDMLISGGENIYPAEIEEAILSHPKVADVAVVGVPDEKWGQLVKAVIAVQEGEELKEDEILKHVMQRIASFKKPRIIQFVDELPKNPVGKLDRKKINEMYAKN
jgi:acyl-CoA synthetase (AMP-forming)/AMP-acid ligase II